MAIELPKNGKSFVNYNGVSQKMIKNDPDFSFDHLQMSQQAHIIRIRSAHGYYRLAEYELRTPSHLGDTLSQIFSVYRETAKDPIVDT